MPGPDPRKTRPLPGRGNPARPLTREERKKLENKKTKKTLSIKDAAKQVIAEGGSPRLIQNEARMNRMDKLLGVIPSEKMAKGGRAGYKNAGSVKGCKMAKGGRGRAYGKNS